MNILHIYFGKYKPGNGIYTVIDILLKNVNTYNGYNGSIFLKGRYEKLNSSYDTYYSNNIAFNKLVKTNDFHLVIFHGIFFIDYWYYYRICINNKIPFLIKPHSSLMRSSWKKSRVKKWLFYYLGLNLFLRKANGIIFINNEEQKNSYSFNPNSLIEQNGVEFSPNSFRKTYSHKIRLLFFSRIDFYHKGLDYLLQALCLLKDKGLTDKVEFNFYGVGEQNEVAKLNAFIKKYNLSFVEYRGGIYDESQRGEMFSNSDILVLTSRYEGFPTVITEALYFGIPPIVTPETNAIHLQEANIGWNCLLESNSIANTVIRAIDEYEKNSNLIIQSCKDFVTDNYTINKTLQQTIEMYNIFQSTHNG